MPQNFTNTSNQIRLKVRQDWLYEEGYKLAGQTVKPGYLVDINSSGLIIAHAGSGLIAEKMIAIEDRLQGLGLADAYADGALVRIHMALPGDVVLVVLKAGSTAVVVGDYLMSNGDGTFVKKTSTNVSLFRAVAALDISGGSTDTLIAARCL